MMIRGEKVAQAGMAEFGEMQYDKVASTLTVLVRGGRKKGSKCARYYGSHARVDGECSVQGILLAFGSLLVFYPRMPV